MCKVTISTVNGVVSPNAVDPTQIQVTGTFQSCAAGNVLITVKDSVGNVLAGPSLATSVNTGTGQWVGFLNVLPGAVQCGSALTVEAECASDSTCQASLTIASLPCCDIHVQDVIGVVFAGALEPGAISVTGYAFGLFGSQVTIAVTDAASGSVIAGPGTYMVDAITGVFSGTLTAIGIVQCDENVKVNVTCTQNTSCSAKLPAKLVCPLCSIRAQVGFTTTACTGTPPMQPVTLNATICVPNGAIECYRWKYGDGSPDGPVFTIDNSAGDANKQYQHSETHNYPVGTFHATLVWVDCTSGQVQDDLCPPIPLTITTSCCPVTVTITSITTGPCSGNGTQAVTINFSVSGVPSMWLAGLVGLVNGIQQGSINCGNGNSSLTLQLPATSVTSYSVGLRIISPTGCPDITRKAVTGNCPCCVPTPNLSCTVSGCAPGTASVTFDLNPTMPWNWPGGCTQQSIQATGFDLEISSGGVALFRRHTTSLPVSSQDNAWQDISTGVTGPMTFSAAGGMFTVGVVAQLSGLTCASSLGSASFNVDPCCPQLTGLTGMLSGTDPCTVDFFATVVGSIAGASFTWTFTDGTVVTTTIAFVSHTFPSSTTSAGVTVVMSLSMAGCPPEMASAMVPLSNCSCPAVSTPTATVTGCIGSGSTASVSLATSVTPAVAGSSINWTVTGPSGTPFTKTTAGLTTTDGTGDGAWTNGNTGATGALDVTAAGSYAVSISATGPSIPASCSVPAPKGFSIPTCGSSGGGSSISWGCVVLRWLVAFFFIVAGLAWILYFCAGPILAANQYTSWIPPVLLIVAIVTTVAAIALLVIWLLLPICTGKPCRWALLLWWQVSIGFGTAAFYLIQCCLWTLVVGIISLTIGTAVLIWWWVACKRTACQVAIELAPVIAAVIALMGYVNLFAPLCLNGIVAAIVATISAGLTIALALCAASGTGPSGN